MDNVKSVLKGPRSFGRKKAVKPATRKRDLQYEHWLGPLLCAVQ